MVRDIKKIAVIGSGFMGSGIALVSARSGYLVYLMDVNAEALGSAVTKIQNRSIDLDNGDQARTQDTMKRLVTSTSLEEATKDVDLVIEAVAERLEVKQKLFKQLDALCPSETILASNTSALTIAEIVSGVSDPRKLRCGGVHFLSPVSTSNLVEVIPISQTSTATLESLMAFVQAIGKQSIKCKDTSGFIVNRIVLLPVFAQALQMLDRGDATLDDIELGVKPIAFSSMGVFGLMDFIGLDVVLCGMENMSERFPETGDCFKPTRRLRELVAEGKLGLKTGEGFLKYDEAARAQYTI
ncbi:unnamed protein product [Cyprideis torosa]|uniref:Uncharacterized protein n=1 Tax=Cyprideis torosa TaxID=163714 RepID=A0A7R8W7B1_9CRUS|nr:unnamed protein product [Cyprideis torosa]CAG0887374.1 unnamed protein product [Cyprideis torosa]